MTASTDPPIRRSATLITWASALVIVLSLLVLVREVPVDRGIVWIEGWIEGVGVWGPLVYALLYAAAVVLLVPGSALTLAGGAVFGLGWGTCSVSIGATLGAAGAFVIARYVARDRVAAAARRHPKFGAIDRALGEGGWKVVALLRLTPVVPFSVSNYLFGLTPVRFWPYVLASWVFMLPGAFLYVYIGYVGGEGIAAAAGAAGDDPAGVGVWTARIVGLAATIAVTVYVTRLAALAVRQQAGLAPPRQRDEERAEPGNGRWPRGATATAMCAVVLAAAAGVVHFADFGPPRVVLAEAYEDDPDAPAFDHALLDKVLHAHVDDAGLVDYRSLAADPSALDAYVESLAAAPLEGMARDERLALLINAYNAFTLRLILDHYPVTSIKDIPASKRWDDRRWNVGGEVWSLNQIEHEQIRPKFREPRIHFALVCAAVGCPPLRAEAYTADRLETQLEAQAEYVHTHDRWFRFEESPSTVYLTKLYEWYGSDFEQTDGSVLVFAARYAPQLQAALEAGRPPKIRWLDYDWSLNEQKKKN